MPNIYDYLTNDETDRLMAHFGGFDLYIPKSPTPELINTLGLTAVQICRVFGGETVYIYKNSLEHKKAEQKAFLKLVKAEIKKGTGTINAIRKYAHEFDYSQKWGQILLRREGIKKVKNTPKKQLPLFETKSQKRLKKLKKRLKNCKITLKIPKITTKNSKNT